MKACPFCAERVQDAEIMCKHCGEHLGGSDAKPTLRCCDRCGVHKSTKLILFRQNVSYLIQRQEKSISGYFCLSCMTKVFLKCEVTTLLGTWWGAYGAFVGPGILLSNFAHYASNAWLHVREGA